MHRFALDNLRNWASQDTHKPLVLRGARQVGKSYLVKLLAQACFHSLVEINFEQQPDMAELFVSKQPDRIVPLLELRTRQTMTPGKTLLFLDEIQAAPEVLATLRYFYEQMPNLHVIAAGSLLEFVLEKHTFSMPVGRIEYFHLGPLAFEEFLLAMDEPQYLKFIQNYALNGTIAQPIHSDLMTLFKAYLVIGGMPEAVARYSQEKSFLASDKVLSSILATYRDDFSRYGPRVNPSRLTRVFSSIPTLVGNKLKYTQIDRDERSRDLKQALHQLENARVVYRVRHSQANGIPLGATVKEQHFKALFLDVGLMCRACGLSMDDIQSTANVFLINSGAVCEQFVGQHLLYGGQGYEDPQLYCWIRQAGSSNAEVDYVIQQGQTIIPVEVKAGKTGSLKSLHVFLAEKQCRFGLRFNADLPSLVDTRTSVAGIPPQPFHLLSLPLYLVGQTKRLCKEALHS